jgi:hypothetical protein
MKAFTYKSFYNACFLTFPLPELGEKKMLTFLHKVINI